MTSLRMRVDGMTCEHCATAVERALTGASAESVAVDFRRGEARADFAGNPQALAAAVQGAGYRPGAVERVENDGAVMAFPGGGEYDLVAIGAGSTSFAAAIRAVGLGARVALVERGTVGGTCVNVGCIPSKHLLAASEAYHHAGHQAFTGVATAQLGVDIGALIGAKDEIVEMLREQKYLDLAEHYGFELIQGSARFTSPATIAVNDREIRAERFLIATGAVPWAPPIPGLEEAGYLTSTTAMELADLPESLVVIGGNYIGLELGQLFANLGVPVTIVEALDRLAPLEEPEVSAVIEEVLAEQGVEVVTGATVVRAEAAATKVLWARVEGRERRFAAQEILVATGRRPALDGLDLDAAGIARDERGRLVLDEELRTTNPRVFAAGDVTGSPQFVYVSAAHGTLAADNAINDAGRRVDYTALPRVTFTHPNIAAVGLTEAEAQAAGHDVDVRVLELKDVPRAIVTGETRGLIKLVAERGSGRVLGVHAAAPGAGDVILAGVYAVKFGLSVQDLAETWAPYLTMAEALKLAAQTFTSDVARLSCCAA